MISQLYMWSRWALYLGRSFDATIHTHHAVQLAVGLDGPLCLNKGSANEQQLPVVIISSETPHSLQAQGDWVASIYFEPESEDCERMIDYFQGNPEHYFRVANAPAGIQEQFLNLLRTGVNPDIAQSLLRKMIEPSGRIDGQRLDTRIIKVLRYLQEGPGLTVSAAVLAHYVSLSPDRLTHLFRQEVGIPIRRFILWQKLRRATLVACQGKSLTVAAHAGGFTDSAHFTHSFQKLFGINPSFLFSPQHPLNVYVG